MQQVGAALQTVLEVGTDPGSVPALRDLVWLFELYAHDTLPGSDGFDPADAEECFASQEIVWLGQAYRRAVLKAGDISIKKGQESNRCTLTLSNADEDRYVAQWVTANDIEGMRLVVRLISRSASTTLATSAVRFVGRCEKPEGFDTTQGTITATANVGDTQHEWPPRLYVNDDPEGRSPADPLNEGFPFLTLSGSFTHRRPEPDKNFRASDPRRYFATLPYSSYDDTPLGDAIPIVGGRTQMRVNRGVFVDRGRETACIDFICMGPIYDILNFRQDHDQEYAKYFTQPENVTKHLGEAGGTGTQIADPLWPNHPLFSYTAYVGYSFRYIGTGSFAQVDAGQPSVMVVLGMVVALPNTSGVFNASGWTDNGAYLTRHLLTDSRYLNLDEAFVEDSACYETGLVNDKPVVDDTNDSVILIPDPDLPAAGVDFLRFRSTGLITPARARFDLGIDAERPETLDVGDFTGFDPDDPPTLVSDVRRLRKQFATNFLLKKRVKGLDFLFNTVLPSFRGFLAWNWKGKIEIRSERPADFTHLRAATSVGATSLLVDDVTPWKASGGLWGHVVVGGSSGLTTKETRKVTAAAYTADANAITLTSGATGTVTATASGATLSGGNSTTQATGTVTVGGTAQAGAQITATIQGTPVVYTLEATDTLATAAYMVAAHINANTQLRRFVSASASGAVVTVTSKWGVLTLSSSPSTLANTHAGPAANPTATPTASQAVGGSLEPGVYRFAFAYETAVGTTYPSPVGSVTVTNSGYKFDIATVGALPAGVTSVRWYVSKAPDDTELVYHGSNNGSAYAVTALPSSLAGFAPEWNTTGEEVVRIAMPFASGNQTAAILTQAGLTRNNIFDKTYKWPLAQKQQTYTQVVGNYVNAKDDFAASKVEINDKALREKLGKTSPRELDLTAVDNYPQARQLCQYDFSKYIDHHFFVSLKGNGLALLLEEDDVIASSDDSGGHVNLLTRVEEFTIHLADFTVSINKARLYTTGMFREKVPKTRPVIPSVLRWTQTLDTEWQVMDLPVWKEEERGRAVIRVAIRPEDGTGDWRGTTIWLDRGDGAGFQQIGEHDVIATMGELVTDMPAASPHTFTGAGVAVRVRVDGSKTLESRTADEVMKGANLARAAGQIFKFTTATLVSSTATTKTYDLTGIQSGLYGTELETAVTGDDFTLLDGSEVVIDYPEELIDREVSIKVLTVNRDLADTTAQTVTLRGNSRNPAPPHQLPLAAGFGL